MLHFFHALTGLPVIVEGEVALNAFELRIRCHEGLSIVAVTTGKLAERKRFFIIYGPLAIKNGLGTMGVINVY